MTAGHGDCSNAQRGSNHDRPLWASTCDRRQTQRPRARISSRRHRHIVTVAATPAPRQSAAACSNCGTLGKPRHGASVRVDSDALPQTSRCKHGRGRWGTALYATPAAASQLRYTQHRHGRTLTTRGSAGLSTLLLATAAVARPRRTATRARSLPKTACAGPAHVPRSPPRTAPLPPPRVTAAHRPTRRGAWLPSAPRSQQRRRHAPSSCRPSSW